MYYNVCTDICLAVPYTALILYMYSMPVPPGLPARAAAGPWLHSGPGELLLPAAGQAERGRGRGGCLSAGVTRRAGDGGREEGRSGLCTGSLYALPYASLIPHHCGSCSWFCLLSSVCCLLSAVCCRRATRRCCGSSPDTWRLSCSWPR